MISAGVFIAQEEVDRLKKLAQAHYNSKAITRIIKLLDKQYAELLIENLIMAPDEVIKDLVIIERGVIRGDAEEISELLQWQNEICRFGKPCTAFMPQKKEDLLIFKHNRSA